MLIYSLFSYIYLQLKKAKSPIVHSNYCLNGPTETPNQTSLNCRNLVALAKTLNRKHFFSFKFSEELVFQFNKKVIVLKYLPRMRFKRGKKFIDLVQVFLKLKLYF